MFEQAFKNIDDVLWKDAGCAGALGTPQLTLGAHVVDWKWPGGDGQLEMTGAVERPNLPFAPAISQ